MPPEMPAQPPAQTPAPTSPLTPSGGANSRSLPSQPVPNQPVPVDSLPTQPISAQPASAQTLLVQPLPIHPVSAQPFPAQPFPVQPVPIQESPLAHLVLIFKETLLPASETFILAQMQALTRYPAVLAGLERTQPSLPLPAGSLLLTEGCGWLPAARAKLYRRLAIAPLFHRALARTEPALVHAHFASGGRTAMALARKLGVPLLVTLHGADVTVRGQRNTHGDAYQELGEEARLFLCVSDFIRRRAIEAGLPAAKCLVHHIGIDRDLFAPAAASGQSTRSILFIGRLVDKKGCEYLLRAMHRVQQQLPDAALTILGDGPLRASLEALAATLALRCTFLGSRPSAEVRQALEQTRVLCAPSVTAANGDSEGLPTVIAEAQAMGVPVVATSHAGIPEIVFDGLTGLLVPEQDTEALAHALITLLSDPDLWQRASRAAQHRIAEHFDLRQQTSLLEQIYDRALAKA